MPPSPLRRLAATFDTAGDKIVLSGGQELTPPMLARS
jgi:hypothetical protein